MSRERMPWFRFYVETTTDPKIRRLTPAQRWLWTATMSAARESCVPGYLMLGEGLPYTPKDLAQYAGMRPSDVKIAVELMTSLGLMAYDESAEAWFLPRWGDRQFESDDVTERTARHRASKSDPERTETGSKSEKSDPYATAAEPRATGSDQRKRWGRNVRTSLQGTRQETETDTESERDGAHTNRGTRIPDEFVVTDEMRGWVESTCPNIEWRLHTANFVDWAKSTTGRNAVKRDWKRAWQVWMRREEAKVPQWARNRASR